MVPTPERCGLPSLSEGRREGTTKHTKYTKKIQEQRLGGREKTKRKRALCGFDKDFKDVTILVIFFLGQDNLNHPSPFRVFRVFRGSYA